LGRPSGLGTTYSAIRPSRSIRPIRLPASSLNHIAPSGPGTIAIGRLLRNGMSYSSSLPSGVTRAIRLAVSSVAHMLPSGPALT
jgi:hypothetical protein